MHGEEWMVYVVEEEIHGLRTPKVVEWDDLQQELARLWSLTSELKSAKERKEALAQRLESVIEVRRESLCQSNELEEMKQRLEARKTLSAADQQLQEANKSLAGKKGQGDSASSQSRKSTLTILGQQLTVFPVKKLSFLGTRKKFRGSATVLGYVAHAVLLIASYLDVPFAAILCNSLGGSTQSYVVDYAPSVEAASSDLVFSSTMGTNGKPMEFPLFLEGQDTTRAAYAVFFVEQGFRAAFKLHWHREFGTTACIA
ncbi:hypothetical protein J5N97_003628 [Dioscorea zingiberensis]|uniref:Uncharacterized protein n=1 Tax=Dioscorea zingiberensis TaxID=325984 RepID=A0A9D5D6H7_9LILI|nr:hypothetical protein J5N97_003628 [Dioscorea zingiberensis]